VHFFSLLNWSYFLKSSRLWITYSDLSITRNKREPTRFKLKTYTLMFYLMWFPMFPLGITRMSSLDMYSFLFPLFLYTTIIYLIYTQRTSCLTWIILAGAFSFIFILVGAFSFIFRWFTHRVSCFLYCELPYILIIEFFSTVQWFVYMLILLFGDIRFWLVHKTWCTKTWLPYWIQDHQKWKIKMQ
jgi:hypothetical protein